MFTFTLFLYVWKKKEVQPTFLDWYVKDRHTYFPDTFYSETDHSIQLKQLLEDVSVGH